MSIQTILVRLQLNWSEVPGISRAITYTMTSAPDEADLPVVYPFQLGAMTDPVPNTNGEAGEYEVIRRYGYRVLYAPANMASTDSANLGAAFDVTAAALVDNAIDYFIAHPRLATQGGQPELGLLTRDVLIQDSGIVTRPGPDGTEYRATDYTFTIGERRFPASPYIS